MGTKWIYVCIYIHSWCMDTYEYVSLLQVAIGILKEINLLLENEVKAVSLF